LASVMDTDPGEGTSDGRVQRKLGSAVVEIKQEPDIKDEPSNGIEFDLMTRPNGWFEGDAATATSNIESEGESESDFIIDFDLNDVKEEVKCEEEKPEKGKENASSMGWSSDVAEPNALDGQDNEQRDGSKAICKRLNANGKGKKRDGSRKQNGRKIPRNKAAKKRKEHKCHVCGYVTSHKSHLNAHIRSHTGDRPYKCDQCSKSFTLKCNLNQHKQIHSESKPFECS
ncbi:zinc finger protein 184-like, partial [Sitodiplosis mosellana]|uniref:zinc finger protein 184-like n=1 Tax=Sitodiplosis mosellana TaxID=263140 RepID=UPI002444B776